MSTTSLARSRCLTPILCRALISAACLLLTACSGWISDQRLFGAGDWAHLDINGRYKPTIGSDATKDRMIFKTRADGLIEGHSTNNHDKSRTLIGLVAIKGGSGEYFLSVDRSDSQAEGDQYFIVRVAKDRSIEYFIPNCADTPPIDGMTKERGWPKNGEAIAVEPARGDPKKSSEPAPAAETPSESQTAPNEDLVCKFTTREALMTAGLQAEEFLSAKHIVVVTPAFALERDDPADQTTTKRPTRRPRPQPSRR